MNLPDPFFTEGNHFAIVLRDARALFTTRRGGVSVGPYESLNLGRWTDDSPAAVEHNRAALARSLDVQLRVRAASAWQSGAARAHRATS